MADSRALAPHVAAGSGPPLILLHGISGSGRWWSGNIPALAEHFRTYAVDLPGFGANRGAPWRGLDATADWLAAWMESMELPRARVAGHSIGGAVAARLALRQPQRVERLALVAAAIRPGGSWAPARAGDVWRTVRRRPPGLAPILVRDVLRTHPRSFVAAMADAIQSDWTGLARIAAPTLVVWGDRDAITPAALGREIAAAIPGAQLAILPEVGHNPMWEAPEAFNATLLRFLRAEPPEAVGRQQDARAFTSAAKD